MSCRVAYLRDSTTNKQQIYEQVNTTMSQNINLNKSQYLQDLSEQEQEIIVRIIKMLIRQLRGTSKFQLF